MIQLVSHLVLIIGQSIMTSLGEGAQGGISILGCSVMTSLGEGCSEGYFHIRMSGGGGGGGAWT